MNKRSFFKSLALLAGAASISPHIFIPKLEAVHWKVTRNPGWEYCRYTIRFVDLAAKWDFDVGNFPEGENVQVIPLYGEKPVYLKDLQLEDNGFWDKFHFNHNHTTT